MLAPMNILYGTVYVFSERWRLNGDVTERHSRLNGQGRHRISNLTIWWQSTKVANIKIYFYLNLRMNHWCKRKKLVDMLVEYGRARAIGRILVSPTVQNIDKWYQVEPVNATSIARYVLTLVSIASIAKIPTVQEGIVDRQTRSPQGVDQPLYGHKPRAVSTELDTIGTTWRCPCEITWSPQVDCLPHALCALHLFFLTFLFLKLNIINKKYCPFESAFAHVTFG